VPLLLVLILAMVTGIGFALFDVWWNTAMAERIPPHALSRVSSYDALGSFVLVPVGVALAGELVVAAIVEDAVGAAPRVRGIGLVRTLEGVIAACAGERYQEGRSRDSHHQSRYRQSRYRQNQDHRTTHGFSFRSRSRPHRLLGLIL